MNVNKNTCKEYFTYKGIRYRRQYFQYLFWYSFKDNFPHESSWVNVRDEQLKNNLETMYVEFITKEKRIKILKSLL